MDAKVFKAMVVQETPDHQFIRQITHKAVDELPEGEVLIKVHFSSLNYKDALSAHGNKGVTRSYPHTPGVDAAGTVVESTSEDFHPGEQVIVTGYDLGMNTSGGFGQYIRVPAGWALRLPDNLSLWESMAYGTAGFTAALCVDRLMAYGITPDQGEILVTGATGGVGSIAVGLLARSGYEVVAATGKAEQKQFLLDLGAKEILSREEARDTSGRALLKGRWAGAIDTVGGDFLSTAIKSTRYAGAVACCGNVASPELSLTVYPFILRGVSLLGIDSVNCPMDIRLKVWDKIAHEWKLEPLDRLAREITLEELDHHMALILNGQQTGRVVVNLWK